MARHRRRAAGPRVLWHWHWLCWLCWPAVSAQDIGHMAKMRDEGGFNGISEAKLGHLTGSDCEN